MSPGEGAENGFQEILRERARGPKNLGPLDTEMCERAMDMILTGEATPAQIGGFLLVGRAAGDDAQELAGYTRALRSAGPRDGGSPRPSDRYRNGRI